MLGVNGWEVVLLMLIAVFVLGPDRLPEYAAKLARGIRQLRVMAEGAKGQLKDQLGPEYEDINWQQYDPRQYDPRRIVREALLDPLEEAVAPIRDEIGSVQSAASALKNGAPAADADAVAGAAAAGGVAAGAVSAGGATGALERTDAESSPPSGLRSNQQNSAAPRARRDVRAWDPVEPTPFDLDAT